MRKFILILLGVISFLHAAYAKTDSIDYQIVKAKVVDGQTNQPLTYCNILLVGTHIATVTNSEGDFILKVPVSLQNAKLSIHHIAYRSVELSAEEIIALKGVVRLTQTTVFLPEIDVLTQNADALIKLMLEKTTENYPLQELYMTGFYRESIRKGRRYVSLSEAVAAIQKQSYGNYRYDFLKLLKARKQTDYTRLDTLAFKLMGGPHNCLLMDIMKYPNQLLSEDVFENYNFSFENVQWIDDRLIYIVGFYPRKVSEEAFYKGKFYIDAKSMALKSALFSIDLSNLKNASNLFIKKKPPFAKIEPTQADYRIDYIEKAGKWYYAYGRIELDMKINWRRKLFNSHYFSVIEMAITNHEEMNDTNAIKHQERFRRSAVLTDQAAGFADPDFWGSFNLIEPDKPIETAIKKINKQIEKL